MTAMPMLMEKKDWARTISSFGNVDRVWREDVSGGAGVVPLSLPGLGQYRVYIVEVGEQTKRHRSAHDLIGYCRKYGGEPHTTEEWMHELREGESTKTQKKVSLFDTLRSCPFGGVELNVERDHTAGRQIEFA